MHATDRVRRALRRHGPLGLARRVARDMRPAPRRASVAVWYALDLASPDRPHPTVDPQVVVRRATADDLWLLEQLPVDPSVRTMSEAWIDEQRAEGAQLWLAHEGDRAAFRCWVFARWFPLGEARGGGIRPPAEVVILEDSLSSPAFRGRGIAPAAWATIADAC